MASQPPLQILPISTEIIPSDSQPQFPPTVIKTINEHFLLTPKVIEALTEAIRNSTKNSSSIISLDNTVAAVEIEKKAGEAYRSNEFNLAIDLYSQAINENGIRRAGLFADRALANIKISKFSEAIDDAEMAIRLDPSLAKAYLHKGIACLRRKEFQAAKTTLEAGAALPPHDVRFSKLIRECEIHLPRSTAESIAGMEEFPNYDHTSNTMASTDFYDKEDDCIQSGCFNESLIDSCVIVNEDGGDFHQQDLHKDNQTLSQDWTPTFTTDMKFDERQGLVDWVRKLGAKNGMVLVIYRSSNDSKRAPRIWMACEHNGYNKPREKKTATVENGNIELVEASKRKRKRKTLTKKQGCPFRIKGICVKGTWTMEVMNGTHNHPLATSLEGRAYAGRLNPEEEKIFADLMRDGVKVREALTILKQRDPENVTTLQTLYNLKKKLRAQEKCSEAIEANACVYAVGL